MFSTVKMHCYKFLLFITTVIIAQSKQEDLSVDPNGYILYCPCMGRFGNQADQFLGALAFAKDLNRTLVLPPWVEYRPGSPRSVQIPFDTYFKVEPIKEYHRVLTMEMFMKELADTVWPKGERIVLCYASRKSLDDPKKTGCNAKDGNPFGPFWDTFNIEFDFDEFYGPLHFNTNVQRTALQWSEKFPSKLFPVIAFTGPPGTFPVAEVNAPLQKYLVWSDDVEKKANDFLQQNVPDGKYVGIHLRNGRDWVNTCKHVETSVGRNLFASAQCLGYRNEHGQLTEDICFPSEKVVLEHVRSVVEKVKVNTVFVAADSNHMISELTNYLKDYKVKVLKREPSDPHVDLAILIKSTHYVANCVSTFSAFATRARLADDQKPTSFWGFKSKMHDEL